MANAVVLYAFEYKEFFLLNLRLFSQKHTTLLFLQYVVCIQMHLPKCSIQHTTVWNPTMQCT